MSNLNMLHPLKSRLKNVRNKVRHFHYDESLGFGVDNGKDKVIVGTQGQFVDHWRNLQHADDVKDAGIDHTGWFTDEFQDGKIRGAVVQLPSRNGKETWLAGYEEDTSEQYVFYLSTYESAKDAARVADGHAESVAEREREYQAKWQIKLRREEITKEIAERKASVEALEQGLVYTLPDTLKAAIKESADSHQADIEKLERELEKSVDEWGELADIEV